MNDSAVADGMVAATKDDVTFRLDEVAEDPYSFRIAWQPEAPLAPALGELVEALRREVRRVAADKGRTFPAADWPRKLRELAEASLVAETQGVEAAKAELGKLSEALDRIERNARSDLAFAIREIPKDTENETPAHFSVVWTPSTGAPTKAEREFIEAIHKEVDGITENKAREHPDHEKWLNEVKALADAGLVKKEKGLAVAQKALGDLSADIHFALQRFSEAPFRVALEGEKKREKRGPLAVALTRRSGTQPPSADQLAFLNELEETEHFLEALYRPSLGVTPPLDEKSSTWGRLTDAARLALQHRQPDLAIARTALRGIVSDAIRDRGPEYRRGYLTGLWQSYLKVFLVAAAALFLFHWLAHPATYLGPGCSQWISGHCWTLPDSMRVSAERLLFFAVSLASLAFGAWLSACARLDTNSSEVLTGMVSSEANPTLHRAVMVLGFGAVALILLHTGMVVIEIGGGPAAPPAPGATPPPSPTSIVFDSKNALRHLPTCILVGVFLGLCERTLPAAINERAAAFVAGLSGAGAPAPR